MSQASSSYQKSLPEVTSISKAFWDGAKRHELLLQRCSKCGNYQFYPRPWCMHCGNRQLEWAKVTGKGTVYSFTVIRQVIGNSPAFQQDIPFVIAEVDLNEGARIFGTLVGVRPEDMRIGMEVQVIFDDVTSEVALPKFKPT